MSRLRVAFIGGGMMAQVGHIPFFVEDPRCDVAAVCESRPSLIQALTARFAPIPIVASHDEILADPTIDAVVISVPRPATGPMVLRALEAGKHVISEKPMAHDLPQAHRLVTAAASRALSYDVGFMKRYDGGVQAARRLVGDLRHDGRLGRLLAARCYNFSAEYAVVPPAHTRPRESRVARFSEWPTAPEWLATRLHASYAWFMNVFCHDINLMRFLLGDNLAVVGGHRPNERTVVGLFQCDDVAVTLETAKAAIGHWAEGAEFLFESGRVTLLLPSPMATGQVAQIAVDARGGAAPLVPPAVPGWQFKRQAGAFIAALTGGEPSLSPGSDCLNDLALIEDLWRLLND
ncbi:MAG: Gfo/Idh/MocA family oxidoreductase [Azospirillaceae bacterium]|nr:Gfo/Idh/MocA family oxidoreductase [Azospirillaceae bacterium]